MLKLTPDDFDACIAVNVKSVFLCSKAVVPHMQERGQGVIINIASIGGRGVSAPGVGFALYGASKAAVLHLTVSMAVEFAPSVRVNAIAPGQISTERVRASWTPDGRAAMLRTVALGRHGMPEDISGAAVFIASDAASWMTGACIDVTGGLQNPDRRVD